MTDNAVRQFRAALESEVKGNKLYGHAAVFDQVADLGQFGLESLARSAFDGVLKSPETDVRALFNHDPNFLLGRQSSGTLRVGTDSEGLEFEVDLPDTSTGRDVRILAERGDLTGASFAFLPGEDEWTRIEGRKLRTHTSVAGLLDVSPVTFPAYEGASVALRARSTIASNSGRSQLIRARARVHLGRIDR